MIRVVWNILPAMNGSGTGLWDMTEVLTLVHEESSGLCCNARVISSWMRSLLSTRGVNPRPTIHLESCSRFGYQRITGIELETAVWYSVVAMSAVFGALIVLPVAASARTLHSKTAGGIVAWLIALMPSHVGHSTLGLADHDAFVILFISTAFYLD